MASRAAIGQGFELTRGVDSTEERLIGLSFPSIDYRVLWMTDGLFKIGFGTWMLLLTYR